MPDPASTARPRRPSLIAVAGEWIAELPGLIGDRVELLALELERAGHTLMQLVGLAAAVALLGLTAWFAFWGLAIGGLLALGMPWFGALLVVLGLNLGGALWTLLHMRRIAPRLGLPATRRHLSFKPPPRPSAAPAAPASTPAAASHGPEPHAVPAERRAA